MVTVYTTVLFLYMKISFSHKNHAKTEWHKDVDDTFLIPSNPFYIGFHDQYQINQNKSGETSLLFPSG